jgi:hypothetical protein
VRCDEALKGYATSVGCVVPAYVPTISYVGTGVPQLRNHIQDAQGSGLPGAYPKGRPLNRLYDDTTIRRNRDRACPDSLPRVSGLTCDEYPFAATNQGAWKAGTTEWRTFSWCNIHPTRYDTGATGFSRCLIDGDQNSLGGTQLLAFWTKNRVLDADEFRIKV